jgi:ArsR family transcriptional regulator, virulence genes transcriptional regulator
MMKPILSEEIRKSAVRQAMLCKIFSNAQRVLILWILAEKERTVTEIAQAIGSSLQSTSQHLRLMELSNLVASRRERHNIFYHVASNNLVSDCLVLANRPKEQLFQTKLEA